MSYPRIVVAAPKSGSGKTFITISLIEALKHKGKKVSAFKCGPDYIDPLFHKKVLGVPSKNLDLFFTDEEATRAIFMNKNDSEISVIEGVMGLYDGIGGITDEASTYHLAKTLKAPVVLVVDAKGMARSLLAEISGFISMDEAHLIKGIILNNMSSMIYEKIKKLIEEKLPVKVLGYFPHQKDIKIESRYLGLKLPDEIAELHKMIQKSSEEIIKTVDINLLEKIASEAPKIESDYKFPEAASSQKKVKIAVARDEAFCFYYEDNLELLKNLGAEIVEFSPLRDSVLPPNIDGLIIGGGYPELYAEKLAENRSLMAQIKNLSEGGIPFLAECGGFMYLHNKIQTQNGDFYEMCGLIDGEVQYKGKLVRFGYVTLSDEKGEKIKAHEFHYFDSTNNGSSCKAEKPLSDRSWECCHVSENHWWGFPHLYYLSNVEFAKNFVRKCCEYKEKRCSK